MAPSLAPPKPRRSTGREGPRARGWWGVGPSPVERWPNTTVDIPAVWSTRLRRWESPDDKFYFDAAEATRACDFFPLYLRHHIGEFAGRPFTLMDYQALLMTMPIFGWKRQSDGLRRFRKLFAFLPKGAGKSPWAAGTGLYLMLCDHEPAAEVYALAADRFQARVVHTNAKIMVEESPELSGFCEVLRDSIYCAETRSVYQVLSADAATKHGFRPHAAIFDEFHAQKNRDLYEAIQKSMVKRRQPLMIIPTHAGNDDEGVCYEEYDLAKRVLSGNIDIDTMLPVIFEMTPADDWADPDIWRRVNPGHGITVQHDAIATECQEALAEPRKRNDFLRFHGNRWTSQATAWIPIEWWDACQTEFTDADLVGLECAAGLDLAQKWDLAAFVVVFRKYLETPAPALEVIAEEANGRIVKKQVSLNYELFVRPFFWIPENTLRQHEKEDGVPYSLWAEQGLVTPTEGDIIDYSRIYEDITTRILPRFSGLKQATIGYDPAFATDIATKLRDLAGLQIMEVLQNYKMLSEPSQVMEALIKGKRVRQDGHRLQRWNWENTSIKTDDAGRIRPVKPRNASKRIDGAVATIIGEKVLSLGQVPEKQFQMLIVGGRT